MKLRKIIAAVLAFALVVTAVPTEGLTKVKAAGETDTYSAIDPQYVYRSDNMQESNGNLGCINQSNVRADKPTIETLRMDVIEEFNASGTAWNWFAYKIDVDEAGTYELGVETNGCKNSKFKIPLCVNNEVDTLSYTNESSSAKVSVDLPIGEHVVVIFSPMPENKAAITGIDNVDWGWCDFKNVIVDSRLTVLDNALTDADVVSSFYTRVEAGNTTYATSDHMGSDGYKLSGNNAKDANKAKITQTLSELVKEDGKLNCLSKNGIPYVQYIAEVSEDGEYFLNVGYQFGGTYADGMDCTAFAVIVNENVYKVEQTYGSSNVWENKTLAVELKAGRNVIRTTGLIKDTDWFNTAWLNHDYLAVESGVEIIPVSQTSVNGGDETKVLANKFTDNGNSLNSVSAGDMRTDLPTIATLPYGGNLIERWPFASVKVTAEKNGYYDITVNAGMNTGTVSPQL